MKRYYDENHKPLKAGEASDIWLDCGDNQNNEWNDSANPDNLDWDGDIPRLLTQEERDAKRKQKEIDALTLIPKLSIRRAMRALGIEDKLDTLLTNPTFKKDWDDANEIDLKNDPMVQDALAQLDIDVNAVKSKIIELNKKEE